MFAVLEPFDFCLIALIIMLFAGGGAAYSILQPADKARMRRIEWKLDIIIRHLGIEYPDPRTAAGLSESVRQLADAGNKIQAIKIHREQTGVGLREAKDAVEAYMNRPRG